MDVFLNHTDAIPKTIVVVEGVGDYVSGLESPRPMGTNIFMIVVIDSPKFDESIPILYQLRRLQLVKYVQNDMKIGVFFPKFNSMVDVQKFYRWCKRTYPEYPILDVFVVTFFEENQPPNLERAFNIYSYTPFGEFQVFNVTGTSYDIFFPSVEPNFHQEQLVLGRPFSIYPDQRLWEIVFDMMNATYTGSDNYNYQVANFITSHVYGQMHQSLDLVGLRMYPLLLVKRNLMVPESLPFSGFAAYIQNATSKDVFTYTFLTIEIVMALLTIFRYLKHNKVLLFQSITDVVNLLMNDNGYIQYQRLSLSELYLILPLTFAGLVIVNGILSNLQSYLIQPVSPSQADTPEEVHNQALSILVNPGWKDHIYTELAGRTSFTDWSERIFEIEKERVMEAIITYNRSVAFIASPDDAAKFIRAQKLLSIIGYHRTPIEFSTQFYTYHISYRFLFLQRLNEIIHRILNSGLFNFWMRKESERLERLILNTNFYRLLEDQTDPNQVAFPMFIIYGWIAGVIVFLLEIFWTKLKICLIKLGLLYFVIKNKKLLL